MKQFLIKALIFIVAFFIFDKAFLAIRQLAPEFDYDDRIQRALDGKIEKNLLLFGSSRGTADLTPWMFEDSLGLSTFNLSYGGAEIEFQYFILTQVLNNCPLPKYIIKLVDDDFELYYHAANAYRVDRLYPLVRYPEVRHELVQQGELNPVLSKLFILSQLKKPVYNFKKPIVLADTVLQYGSMPKKGQRENQDWYVENENTYRLEDEIEAKKAAFMNFQKACLENNITLVLTIPPSFRDINPAFEKRMKELVMPGVHFYVFDTMNVSYDDNSFFQDRYHLNDRGSEIYTAELVGYLREIMNGDIQ